MADPTPFSSSRHGFYFQWWGGAYLDISAAGKVFDVINMCLADGSLPPFTREVFLERLDELTATDYVDLRHAWRESTI